MSMSWFSRARPDVIEQVKTEPPRFFIKEPMIFIRSPCEEEIFTQFKKKVADLDQDDAILIRFLRARDFDIPHAETMIRKMLEWRKENCMDDFDNWKLSPQFSEDINYKFLDNCDYNGVPMMWLPVGRWHARRCLGSGADDKANAIRFGYSILESALRVLQPLHRKQMGLIFDCDGLSYHEASHIESLQVLVTVCKGLEQNYPETISKVFIINAPWVFPIIFNFIKHILSKNTLEKINVFGHNKSEWLGQLLQFAPQQALPQQYFQDENGN